MQKQTLQPYPLLPAGHEAPASRAGRWCIACEADSVPFDGERNLQSSVAELMGGMRWVEYSASASTTSGRSEVSCETPPSERSDNIAAVDLHAHGHRYFQPTRQSLGFSTAPRFEEGVFKSSPMQPTYLEYALAPNPEFVPLNNKWMKSAVPMPRALADDADMAAARLMACGTQEVSSREADDANNDSGFMTRLIECATAEVQNHEATCTKQPCLFAFRQQGCKNGENCNFCHICAITKQKDTAGTNRMRPCKGKRERYRKLVEKLKQSANMDPEFDFGTQKLPPSFESNEWVKSKLEKAVRRGTVSKEVPQDSWNTDGSGTGTSVIEVFGVAVSV